MLRHSCVRLLQCHGALQAPLAMGVPRQEYWSGLPFPYPRNLRDPGIEPVSPTLPGGFFTSGTTWESQLTQERFNFGKFRSCMEDVPWKTAVDYIICQDDLIADLRFLHDQQTRVTSDFSP